MVGLACLCFCGTGWKVQRGLTHMSGALAAEAEMAGACLGLSCFHLSQLSLHMASISSRVIRLLYTVVGFQEEEATSLQKV